MEDTKQKLDKVINNLNEIIDTTHCTYCKEIMGDAEKILTQYESIMDKAEELDRIQSERNEFLNKTNEQADEIIHSQDPQNVTSSPMRRGILPSGQMFSRFSGRQPMSRLNAQLGSNGGILGNLFGDMAPFGYLIGDKKKQ